MVRYDVQAPSAAGPDTVKAELLDQSLGSRYAQELFQCSTSEIRAFQNYYRQANKAPTLLASVDRPGVQSSRTGDTRTCA